MTVRPFPDPTILLHPQIPKPLHLLNPRTLLGDAWWNDVRREAYWRHGYRCHACGIAGGEAQHQQGLEAHEMYKIDYVTGRVEYVEAVALCHFCHNYIHQGRLEQLYAKGEISPILYLAVLRHGEHILADADIPLDVDEQLVTLLQEAGKMCCWEDYHLVIDDVNYGQRFSSFEEWEQYWQSGGAGD